MEVHFHHWHLLFSVEMHSSPFIICVIYLFMVFLHRSFPEESLKVSDLILQVARSIKYTILCSTQLVVVKKWL